jgi:hypothetical protein
MSFDRVRCVPQKLTIMWKGFGPSNLSIFTHDKISPSLDLFPTFPSLPLLRPVIKVDSLLAYHPWNMEKYSDSFLRVHFLKKRNI